MKMSPPKESRHITVVLNAHSETIVAGPTLRSANRAAQVARAQGYTVDLRVGVDRGTPDTDAYFASEALRGWHRFDVDEGDLGEARNRMIEHADDGWIAFLDADDLFSENWLVTAADVANAAARAQGRVAVHPELRWTFEGVHSVAINIPSDSALFLHEYLAVAHTYDSLILSDRATFMDIPYRARAHDVRLGFEDWAWTLDSLVQGVHHVIAPDTIIFKRRRDTSLLSQLAGQRALIWPHPANAIDFDWSADIQKAR